MKAKLALFLLPVILVIGVIHRGSIPPAASAQELSSEPITASNIDQLSPLQVLDSNLLSDEVFISTAMSFSMDNQILYTVGNQLGAYSGAMYIWDWQANTIVDEWTTGRRLENVEFSPDGITVRDSGDMRDVNTGEILESSVGRFSPNGEYVLTFGPYEPPQDYFSLIYTHVKTGEQQSLQIPSGVNLFEISLDGQYIAAGTGQGQIHIANAQTGVIVTVEAHDLGVNSLAFSPVDGNLVSTGWDGTIQVRNPESGEVVTQLLENSAYKDVVTFNPGGTLLIAGDNYGTLFIWDAESYEPITEIDIDGDDTINLDQARIYAIVFSSDGTLLAIGSSWNVTIWGIY